MPLPLIPDVARHGSRHPTGRLGSAPSTKMPWPDSYIAKPIHYVIALCYVREEGGAPLVLSKGKELIAVKIWEIAPATFNSNH